MNSTSGYQPCIKQVLVSGASSGIGRAVAIELSNRGHKVICQGRDEIRLAQTLSSLSGNGHSTEMFDLAETAEVENWTKLLLNKYGSIKGFVHAAGIQQTLPLPLLRPQTIEYMFGVNVESGLLITKELIKHKDENKVGSIVFISSVMGQVGLPGYTLYSLCKGALDAMVRSLALELAPKNIRVNAVAPGSVKTPMLDDMYRKLSDEQVKELVKRHPLGIGSVEDVANLVAFLLSDGAKWITGTVLTIDGGYTAQ